MNQPVSPTAGKTDLLTYTIKVGEAPLPGTYQVSAIRVHKQINRIAYAKITLFDGSAASANFLLSSSALFEPGAKIEITAGYHSQEATLFQGKVVKHGIKIGADRKSYLVVTCYDQALALTVGRKSGYTGNDDSATFTKLITDAGAKPHCETTTATHDEVVRYYATDWDFLVARAEINGQIVLVDDGTVTVQAPKPGNTPALLIRYGDALQEIQVEVDARIQLPPVTCSAWDFANQAVDTGQSTEPTVTVPGNFQPATLYGVLGVTGYALQISAPVPPAELAIWASAQLLKSRLAMVRGSVSFRGNATPKPGQVIALDGVGSRFNGNAFMSSVVHSIEHGNWVTEVGLGLAPQWFVSEASDVEAPPASGRQPGVGGLLIGKVQAFREDPDGQKRVLVIMPMVNPAGNGIWARLTSPYATAKAGIHFFPELGDEVVLGFLNDDASFPIILGSMHSSTKAPPFAPDAANTYKAIVTKGQLAITMDDVNLVTVIKTPGKQSITLSDKDNSIVLADVNGNTVTLSKDGIVLDSCKDLTLTAKGNVTISANGGKLGMTAQSEIDASAPQINASASSALSLSGDGSAQLQSTGNTVVKGAMVMIN